MIEKKDWKMAQTQFENLIVNAQINMACYESSLEIIKKKISEFPDDKPSDPMPDALKEIVSEVSK